VSPVPTLWHNDQTSREISDLLFLHLADADASYRLTDERAWQPRLARSWVRRDSLTLVFDLDPRATWADGAPVIAADVVLALDRARDPKYGEADATLLRRVREVVAEDTRRVVIRFSEPYAEQFYDVVYHAPPLPSHLVASIPADSLVGSPFARNPVGNGPYRLTRWEAGQQLRLEARPDFYLGRPGIRSVVFLVASAAETRANLLLSGEADAVDNALALPNSDRLTNNPALVQYPTPGLNLNYAILNYRNPADTSQPNAILSDVRVRQALILGSNRVAMARATYGPFTGAPGAPVSLLLGRGLNPPAPPPYDPAAARRMLAEAGWVDRNGDGVVEKDGRPLQLRVMVPAPVAARVRMATEMQESWRRIGIDARLEVVEGPTFTARMRAGEFDIMLHGVGQDPTPSGLVQSWTCAGTGSNFGHYCDPRVDSLLFVAGRSGRNAGRTYDEALRRIAADAPAIFLAAQVTGVMVNRRFTQVRIRPESLWADVWRWAVRTGQARDRR